MWCICFAVACDIILELVIMPEQLAAYDQLSSTDTEVRLAASRFANDKMYRQMVNDIIRETFISMRLNTSQLSTKDDVPITKNSACEEIDPDVLDSSLL